MQVRFLDVHSAILSLAMTAGEQLTLNLQRWFAGADSLNLSHVLAHHKKAAIQNKKEAASGTCGANESSTKDENGACDDGSTSPAAADAGPGVAGGSSGGSKDGTGDPGDSNQDNNSTEDTSDSILDDVTGMHEVKKNCQGGGKGGRCATRDTEGSTKGRAHEVSSWGQ